MTDSIEFVNTSENSDTATSVVFTPPTGTDDDAGQAEAEPSISLSSIVRGIRAVGSVVNLPETRLKTVIQDVTANHSAAAQDVSLEAWFHTINLAGYDQDLHHIATLAAALAFLQTLGREGIIVSSSQLDRVWVAIKAALQCPALPWALTRSAQGLLAIPMWSLIVDGHIDELMRLHVWLPDKQRGNQDVSIHMHQPYGQGWILAGEGTDHAFEAIPANESDATHAEYIVGWRSKEEEGSDQTYKVHSKSSTANHTGKLLRVVPVKSEKHTRDMSYCVPAGVFHRSEVEPDALHATIFFFDSSRGYIPDPAIAGPISPGTFTHERESPNISVSDVVSLVADLRKWEILHDVGEQNSLMGEWEESLRIYRTALHTCQAQTWLNGPRYLHTTLSKIAHKYRMLGLYPQACECLEQAVLDAPLSRIRVDCVGELAVVYRHMDRLEGSKWASEEQYRGAKELRLEPDMCRAIGTLGMVNYQIYLETGEESLLDLAISQIEERVERAQRLGDVTREAIGHGRLSVCHMAKKNYPEAITSAQRNYDLMQLQHDVSKIGFAGAFYGRALLLAGRKEEALALFNPPAGCTPIISLCREISDEHRQYIKEIIAAGADLKLRDNHGYTALECTVYNGDHATTKIIEEGLRAQISREGGNPDELTQYQYEANLRKGYRDIFQDKLRPVLLAAGTDFRLQSLRKVYKQCLSAENEKRNTFDQLKYIHLSDFLKSGRLPRSNHGYTQEYTSDARASEDPFILFISYRWIANDPESKSDGDSPDDIYHTQYKRILRAIELFLELHPDVREKKLCIWFVSCFD